jgi:chemotaxis signal transduction protein
MSQRARELAALFDRSFGEPALVGRARGAVALTIMAGGATYLLPLAEVTLVARAPKIVPLPSGSPLQLGVAGLRGNLVTVYSLTALLGQPIGPAEWIAVVREIAIAFDELDGQAELRDAPPNLLVVDELLRRATGGAA